MALYVIKHWEASGTPVGETASYVRIDGRAGGLLSWVLSLVHISPTVKVEVTAEKLVFSEGSLSGNVTRIIPLESICSTAYGYTKPWKEAVMLGLVLLPLWGLGLLVGPLYYFLNKHLTLFFIEVSGYANTISFKRSVIEGKNLDEKQAGYVAEVVQYLIDLKRKRN